MTKLSFGKGNSKLASNIATFSIPAGYTCNQADKCFALANRNNGKISEGKNTEFRCFAATQESVFPSVRTSRWNNFDMLKNANTIEGMANLIQQSLPFKFGVVRCHVSGDFFNEKYFLAWLNVAINNPNLIIYGYTKCLNFLVKYKNHIPSNFRFTASKGGKLDWMISKHRMKYAEVVYSVNEANEKGLELDHDDGLAILHKRSFGLLIHGRHAAKSIASKAVSALKLLGLGFYNETTKGKHIPLIKIQVTLQDGKNQLPLKSVGKKKNYKFIPYTKNSLLK